MKKSASYSRIALLSGGLAIFLMGGCATVQEENPMMVTARESFARVHSDPNVNRYAPLELQEAQTAINRAERSWQAGADRAEVEHLAYLAKQKALISVEVTAMKIADQEVEVASAERNKVLLGARTREAEYSLSQAEKARQEAEMQRRAAEEQRLVAEDQRRTAEEQSLAAEEQRRAAEEQRLAAEKAMKEAQQRTAEAEKARLEAEKARQEAAAAEAKAKKLEAQIVDLQASQTERGLVLTLGDVLFDTGKNDLKAGAYAVIEKLAAFLKEYPNRKAQIEGFTDSVGSDDYNLGLSIRRAESVRNALNGRGIELDRILYRGYGEAFPVASNKTREGRQRNRRVEVVISDENGVIADRIR